MSKDPFQKKHVTRMRTQIWKGEYGWGNPGEVVGMDLRW